MYSKYDLTPKGRNQLMRHFLNLGQVRRVQFVLEIFEFFCREILYMYLEGKLFCTKILFLVQVLCPKNKILVNLGQLG
jgi:hypothetical protein